MIVGLWMMVWAYGVHRSHATSGDPETLDYYRTWMSASVADFTDDDPGRSPPRTLSPLPFWPPR